MSIWEILGISATDDLSVVKKAYAAKLKQHHPEDDPEGYQSLREAYDAAVKQLRQQGKRTLVPNAREEDEQAPFPKIRLTNPFPDEEDEFVVPALKRINLDSDFAEDEEPPVSASRVSLFFGKMELLYDDWSRRTDLAQWQMLFEADGIIWNMKYSQEVSRRMIEFIQERHYLTRSVWSYLDEIFRWTYQREELYMHASNEQIDVLFRHLHDSLGLSYETVSAWGLDHDELDEYLEYREQAVLALQDHELPEAEDAILAALDIYANDPELLMLHAECLERLGSMGQSLQVYDRIIQLDPQHIDALFRRARILRSRDGDAAARDCRNILALQKDHAGALSMLVSFSRVSTNNGPVDREQYLQLLSVCPHHWSARLYFWHNERLLAQGSAQGDSISLYKQRGTLLIKTFMFLRMAWKRLPLMAVLLILVMWILQINSPSKGFIGALEDSYGFMSEFMSTAQYDKKRTIEQPEDWERLGAAKQPVRMLVPQSGSINPDLYQFPGRSEGQYLSHKEGEEQKLFDNDDFNYIYVCRVQGKAVIAIVESYNDADSLFKNKPVTLKGQMAPMPSGLYEAVTRRMGEYKIKAPDNLMADLVLDTTKSYRVLPDGFHSAWRVFIQLWMAAIILSKWRKAFIAVKRLDVPLHRKEPVWSNPLQTMI